MVCFRKKHAMIRALMTVTKEINGKVVAINGIVVIKNGINEKVVTDNGNIEVTEKTFFPRFCVTESVSFDFRSLRIFTELHTPVKLLRRFFFITIFKKLLVLFFYLPLRISHEN